MKPHKELTTGYQAELFRTELSRMVNPKHPMVKVAAGMDWESFETALEKTWHEELGRPGVSTRLMVSLHYLKYVNDLSDEGVVRVVGGEPVLATFKRDEVLRASSPDRGLKPESMA